MNTSKGNATFIAKAQAQAQALAKTPQLWWTEKKYTFDGLSKTSLIALLKKYWKEEEEVANTDLEDEDEQESEASSKASVSKKDDPYHPYD